MAHEQDQARSDPPLRGQDPGLKDEESLRWAIAMLGVLVESAHDLIAIQDPACRFVAFSSAYQAEFKRLFGLDLKVGDRLLDLAGPQPAEWQPLLVLWERTLRGEAFTEVRDFILATPGRRSFEIQSLPLRNQSGQLIGGAHIARDVTEQRRAVEELRASEERLRSLLGALPAAVYTCDAEGRITFYNERAEEVWGRRPVIGQDCWCGSLRLFETDGTPLPLDQSPMAFALRRGERVTNHEVLIERPDGSRVNVMPYPEPILDPSGRIIGVVNVVIDVTAIRRTEEALRTNVEWLKLAQLAGHVGVFDWDIATDHAAIAGELETIFGLEPGVEEGAYENWMRHVHPDDRPPLNEDFLRSIQERRREGAIEFRIIRNDGEVRWVEVKGQISYLETGQPFRIIGTIVDITERKVAEEALRESEEKFRALAENARASFGIVQGRRFVYVNPWFAQISGYSVEELLTIDFPQFVHPDSRPQMVDWARRRQLGAPVPNYYEFAMRTQSGEKRWVEFSVGTIEYRGKPAMIGTGFDVTERKRSEERLAMLSQTAAHLLKAENPDSMIRELFEKVAHHLDLQGYMNFMVNEAGDALHLDSYAGIPEEAVRQVERLEFGQGVCGTVAQCRQPIYAFDIQQSEEEIVQLLKQFDIRAYACNPLLAGERLLGTLAFATSSRNRFSEDELEFMRTISQYVAMAKERLRLEGELRHHIQGLADADRNKDEFLAMLAHELRNPLAPIRNAVQVLKLAAPQEDILERQREIIDRQVTHMSRLLDDLLDVSRITRGHINLRKAVIGLTDVFARAVETANPIIESRGHTLRISLPEEPLEVFGDIDRLIQIVSNLLTNAAKYTMEGGKIWLEAMRETGEMVSIHVRDTGVGIAPEMLPKVFDVFKQIEHSLDRAQGGLGLGLALVRSLTQMHGGQVEAHSAGLGQGCEFIVRLPAIEHLPVLPAAPSSGPTLGMAPVQAETPLHRILVVDDVADTANSLSELLGLLGHNVRTAYDGPSVINIARLFHPDVILLDIGLPGQNGYDVARQIRRDPELAGVILVALTGYGQEEDRRLAQQAGFDRLFTKPVELGALQSLLA